ncbi:hypothetical protein [Aeromonas salmonicida]
MEIDKAIGLIEAHGVFHGDREKLGHPPFSLEKSWDTHLFDSGVTLYLA